MQQKLEPTYWRGPLYFWLFSFKIFIYFLIIIHKGLNSYVSRKYTVIQKGWCNNIG